MLSSSRRWFWTALAFLALLPACGTAAEDVSGPIALNWEVSHGTYEPGGLWSVWASGQNDLWVVGGESPPSEEKPNLTGAAVVQWNGTEWSAHDTGLPHRALWVHGFPGGPVFVSGDRGGMARFSDGAWEVMDTGVPGAAFWGVWGSAPDDVWAVGARILVPGPDDAEPEGDVVIHYDGTEWSRVTIPPLEENPTLSGSLFKVWGSGPNDVWIVGGSTTFYHWDGTTWEAHETPAMSGPFFTIAGRGPNDVWAIGGLALPELLHWDGSSWESVEMPEWAPPNMPGLWTAPGQSVYVAGMGGYTARLDLDGTWEEGEPVTPQLLHGITGDRQGGIYACGGNIAGILDDYQGVLLSNRPDLPEMP